MAFRWGTGARVHGTHPASLDSLLPMYQARASVADLHFSLGRMTLGRLYGWLLSLEESDSHEAPPTQAPHDIG